MTPSGAQMWRAVGVAGLVACLLRAASAGPGAAGARSAAGQVRWALALGACAGSGSYPGHEDATTAPSWRCCACSEDEDC